MAQRINGSTNSHIPTNSSIDNPSSSSTTNATIDASPSTAPTTPDSDHWITSQPNALQEFVRPQPPDSPFRALPNTFAEPARAVWEMYAPESFAAAEATPPSPTTMPLAPPLLDNPVTTRLTDIFHTLATDNAGPATIRRELSYSVFDRSRSSNILHLATQTSELRTHLSAQVDNPRITNTVIAELEDRVTSMAGERIAALATPILRDSAGNIASLNASSDTRRAFLITLLADYPSPNQLNRALRDTGFSPEASQKLTDGLESLRHDPQKQASFIAGDRGDRSYHNLFRGDFQQLDRLLEKQCDSIQNGLQSLLNRLTNNQIRHDQFLTDPFFAHFRDHAYHEMGVDLGPPPNELGDIFQRATERSETSQFVEGLGTTILGIAATTAVSILTAGAGIAFATGALSTSPSNIIAQDDISHARALTYANIGDSDLVDKARTDRNIQVATSVASIILGTASTQMDKIDILTPFAEHPLEPAITSTILELATSLTPSFFD